MRRSCDTRWVAPRLLAPHPNGEVEELSAEQAVALFVLQRFHDIERLKEKFPLLDPTAAAGSADWTWQLYGALRGWGSSGERSGLDTLLSTATNPPRHAAVAVCVSHAMFEDGDLAGARAVVEAGLAVSDLSPSDRRWLQAHKARVVYELGDLDAAREMALTVKGAEKALLGDPSVRALLGSAAQLVLNLGDMSPESLADVVRGHDSMVNLWRNQVVSEGLGKQVEDLFRDWAPDGSVTFGAADVPWLNSARPCCSLDTPLTRRLGVMRLFFSPVVNCWRLVMSRCRTGSSTCCGSRVGRKMCGGSQIVC
jgi:hypothetical protein